MWLSKEHPEGDVRLRSETLKSVQRSGVRLCAIRSRKMRDCVLCCCQRALRQNAFRNRPFDSIPMGKLARLANIIVIGKGKTWFSRLGVEAVRIPGDAATTPQSLTYCLETEEQSGHGHCKKGIVFLRSMQFESLNAEVNVTIDGAIAIKERCYFKLKLRQNQYSKPCKNLISHNTRHLSKLKILIQLLFDTFPDFKSWRN